ncbi:MAG: NAD-dependent epimerase/dehydratase family protein [Gammaproteobacteria bacterium]|nr:NAD-dependent epimerase/dehydratase family protein [Gammaproteobacteria bacterium]
MTGKLYSILVTGGAGYIGSVLCPKLADLGHKVTVLDTLYFGTDFSESLQGSGNLKVIQGDIRDKSLVEQVLMEGKFDRVIHLAAISNDPCSDLDDALTTSVNLDATKFLMKTAKKASVRRFLYASSASVYGIKETDDVTEELPLEPITLYAKYKAKCEEVLNDLVDELFEAASVRAATVCGFSPRLRLDLTVNIFTYQAVCEGSIQIYGGSQKRPNIHIRDLVDFYILLLDAEDISGKAFNVSLANASVRELAEMVDDTVDENVNLAVVESHDNRSYHLSAARAARELSYVPRYSIADAIMEVASALRDPDIVANPKSRKYRNVKFMCDNLDAWK